MKKSTGTKSKPKFAKKRSNSKSDTKKSNHPATDMPQTPPPSDAPLEVRIGGPTPDVRPCSPADTQKGHHEVIQS